MAVDDREDEREPLVWLVYTYRAGLGRTGDRFGGWKSFLLPTKSLVFFLDGLVRCAGWIQSSLKFILVK